MRRRWKLLGAVCLSVLAGCAEWNSPEANSFTREWQKGGYRVRFSVVPKGTSDGRYAYYTVSTLPAGPRKTLASGHSIGGFQSITDPEPGNHIRIVEDVRGGRILIEEDIPNPDAPCKNFILIQREGAGEIDVRYLQLPGIPSATGGEDLQLPSVLRLDGDRIICRYPDGTETTRDLSDIESSHEPNHAG